MSVPALPSRPFRFSVPLTYAVLSVLWIVASDYLVTTAHMTPLLHTAKALLFIGLTSLMLHALIERYSARIVDYDRELRSAERMKVLGQLTARVSHDLRNVLMAAKTMSVVLRRASTDAPRATNASRHLDAALHHGELLLSELLEFVSPRPANTEPLALGPWLDDYAEFARYTIREDIRLDIDLASPDLIADVDPKQLHQLLTNLIMNASEAITGPGTIQLRASAVSGESSGTLLTVRDSGSGMTNDVARRVFDPLFTTKRKGTGLGLPIVARVAAAHGGRVTFDSAPGSGTSFHVFFPANTHLANST